MESNFYEKYLYQDIVKNQYGTFTFIILAQECYGGKIDFDRLSAGQQVEKFDNIILNFFVIVEQSLWSLVSLGSFSERYDLKKLHRGNDPYSLEPSKTIKLEVSENQFNIIASDNINLVSIQIPSEFYRHLKQCRTVSFIASEAGNLYSFSIVEGNLRYPLKPLLRGTISNKLVEKIKYNKNWEYVPGWPRRQVDLLIGDAEYEPWFNNFGGENRLPVTQYSGPCVACGRNNVELTGEHVIPKWLLKELGISDATVSKIFCETCNNWFGKHLEIPAKEVITKRLFKLKSEEDLEIIRTWCTKTALVANIATNGAIDKVSMRKILYTLRSDDYAFLVFPDKLLNGKDFGFVFYTCKFMNIEPEPFLFTFISSSISFVVYRNCQDRDLSLDIKEYFNTHKNVYLSELQHFLVSRISGVNIEYLDNISSKIIEASENGKKNKQ